MTGWVSWGTRGNNPSGCSSVSRHTVKAVELVEDPGDVLGGEVDSPDAQEALEVEPIELVVEIDQIGRYIAGTPMVDIHHLDRCSATELEIVQIEPPDVTVPVRSE